MVHELAIGGTLEAALVHARPREEQSRIVLPLHDRGDQEEAEDHESDAEEASASRDGGLSHDRTGHFARA